MKKKSLIWIDDDLNKKISQIIIYKLELIGMRKKSFRMNSHYIKPFADEINEQTEGIQLLTYAMHVLF
jgi:hypothetical protein